MTVVLYVKWSPTRGEVNIIHNDFATKISELLCVLEGSSRFPSNFHDTNISYLGCFL